MKILLNILTHGDELVGVKVAEEIRRRYPNIVGNGVDIQTANERAYHVKKRYIDHDLNRVFPGDPNGSYEEKRAFELSPIISSYDLVIDVHSTESGSGGMVIVTKIDEATLQEVKIISPAYLLFMNTGVNSALISAAKIGLGLEMGSDKDNITVSKTISAIERLLFHHGFIPVTQQVESSHQTKYFEVFSAVPKPSGAKLQSHINNFFLVKKGESYAKMSDGNPVVAPFDFYPVLFGNTNYESIFGFAARILDFKKITTE